MYWPCGRIAALRGARKLAYPHDMCLTAPGSLLFTPLAE